VAKLKFQVHLDSPGAMTRTPRRSVVQRECIMYAPTPRSVGTCPRSRTCSRISASNSSQEVRKRNTDKDAKRSDRHPIRRSERINRSVKYKEKTGREADEERNTRVYVYRVAHASVTIGHLPSTFGHRIRWWALFISFHYTGLHFSGLKWNRCISDFEGREREREERKHGCVRLSHISSGMTLACWIGAFKI